MSGLLADLYSAGDRMKRKLGGLLSDPMGTVALGSQRMAEDVNALTRLVSEAGYMPNTVNRSDQSVLVSERQKALARALLADKGAEMGMAAATVWHGSPHKFDKFDSSKIGTGEGAQAYGHGLYLAESDRVAKQYADTLTEKAPRFLDGVPAEQLSTAQKSALGLLAEAGGNPNAALLAAKTDMARAGGAGAEFHVERYNTLRDIVRGKSKAQVGEPSLYKVDLPDNAIARMLDWDKPLSQQAPEVQKAASQMFGPNAASMTGQEIYKKAAGFNAMVNVAAKTNGDAAKLKMIFPQATDSQIAQAMAAAKSAGSNDRIAAQMLKDAGIPGIRYLDGGSRGSGQGSSNFVVFPGEEKALTILERNGLLVR